MQVVIPVNQTVPRNDSFQESSSVLENGQSSQEIRDGTPEWKSVIKVVLIVALIAAIMYAGKIIIPKIIKFVTTASDAGATVVEAATTVVDSVATTVERVADSTVTVVESVGTAAEAVSRGVSAVNTSIGVAVEKVGTSVANTIDFIGEALTKPLPVVLIEQFVEHGPTVVDHVIDPSAPWKIQRFLNFIKIF